MRYFTKYLPVSRHYLLGKSLIQVGETIEQIIDQDDKDLAEKIHYTEIKLFLCSKDLNIGDMATEKTSKGYLTLMVVTPNDVFSDMIERKTQFKVIGGVIDGIDSEKDLTDEEANELILIKGEYVIPVEENA